MLLDANILLYAVDERSHVHTTARDWLTARLNGSERVGMPWQSLTAFVRITTHPRGLDRPLSPDRAWSYVDAWLEREVVWIPVETPAHHEIFGSLVTTYQIRGNLVSDAHLAALAIEHGLVLCSADTDFARFRELRWENPLTDPGTAGRGRGRPRRGG